MDSLLLEQHLRSPLGFFNDPMLSQLMPQSIDAALMEKARQHLQIWGRSPYTELLLPQIYQRPNINAALNFGLWQGQWTPQVSAGFLNNQGSVQQAAVSQQHQKNQLLSPEASMRANSESLQLDARSKKCSTRFNPYPKNPNSAPNCTQLDLPQNRTERRTSTDN